MTDRRQPIGPRGAVAVTPSGNIYLPPVAQPPVAPKEPPPKPGWRRKQLEEMVRRAMPARKRVETIEEKLPTTGPFAGWYGGVGQETCGTPLAQAMELLAAGDGAAADKVILSAAIGLGTNPHAVAGLLIRFAALANAAGVSADFIRQRFK